MTERTFEAFAAEVRSLLEPTAASKGYNSSGADGDNPLYQFIRELAGGDGHALGEIVYKARRYAAKGNPEDILKAAAWCFLVWRHRPMATVVPTATVTIDASALGVVVTGQGSTTPPGNGGVSPHPPTGPDWRDRVDHGA